MLNNEKKELLDSMIPKAVLKAVTEESKHSITRREFGHDIIPIYNYPFKIGREARVNYVDGEVILQERHKLGGDDRNGSMPLKDGDIITLGSKESHYKFKFILLDIEYL